MKVRDQILDSVADMADRVQNRRKHKAGLLPPDFPSDEDLIIADQEFQRTGSLLATLRAVRDWREER